MSSQLRLFPLARPLIDRIGADFFKSAPRAPGVYIMRDASERILYIGQSKNLRTRLAYYKNLNPDRMPRRLVRLVHSVDRIALETCESAVAARARELELLQTHRPKFNRADTAPRFFHYLSWERSSETLTISISFEEEKGRGPLKGRMIPMLALGALGRLWRIAHDQLTRCDQLPITRARVTEVGLSGGALEVAANFLEGRSPQMITDLLAACSPSMEPPLAALVEADAELLMSWFRALEYETDN